MNSKNLILKNIIDTEPVLGAAPSNSNVVKFAFTENASKIATADQGQILFSHIPALGVDGSTGVIYVGDQIVSSKVLDASFVDHYVEGTVSGTYLYDNGLYYADNDESIPQGANKVAKQTFTVQYVNVANAIVTASFDNVNPELAKAFVKEQAAADAERLNDLDASVTEIKTFIKSDTVVTAADNASNAVIVEHTDDASGYTSYTVDVKVDDKTVKINGSKIISAPKSIDVSAGGTGEEGKNFIVLKNANGEIESAIDVANIIGNGIVQSATYNPADNKLTIVWATATGDQNTVIDLGALLDINDVFVANDSSPYLGVTLSSSTMTIATKVQDISTADSTHTGLLDASTTKTWILDQLSETNIKAQGDDYISATIDANDNKKIIIDSSVANLTFTATTTGDNPTNATLVGVEHSLVDGAQAATAISNFVNDRIDASIKALDAEQGGKDVNVSVGVTEVDGKITNVSVVETYATVTYTAPQSNTPASLVVTEGTEGGLVTGADINKVKQYVDAQLGDADADVTVTEANTEYVAVTIAERDGVLSAADSSLSVTYAQYGVTDSSGIATDEYVTAAIQALDLASTDANASATDASSLVTVTISETDGIVNMESVDVAVHEVATATADSDGLATAKAVKDALTWTVIS